MPAGAHRDEIAIDVRALRNLALDLRKADASLRRELYRRVRLAAEPVKRAVQAETSWSTRIPDAVVVRSSYASKRGARVKVVVDASKAPEARPLNNHDKPGTFRHPVFADQRKTRGSWTWVSQPARPFLWKAGQRAWPEARIEIGRVYDDIARRAGYHL